MLTCSLDNHDANALVAAAPTPAPTAKKAKTTKGKKVESKSASEEAGEDGEGAKVQSEAGHDSDEDIFD